MLVCVCVISLFLSLSVAHPFWTQKKNVNDVVLSFKNYHSNCTKYIEKKIFNSSVVRISNWYFIKNIELKVESLKKFLNEKRNILYIRRKSAIHHVCVSVYFFFLLSCIDFSSSHTHRITRRVSVAMMFENAVCFHWSVIIKKMPIHR